MRPTLVNTGLDKLQDFLLAMSPGDELSAQRASEISGLDHERCTAVLDTLMHAGLMTRPKQDAYVRCRLRIEQSDPRQP